MKYFISLIAGLLFANGLYAQKSKATVSPEVPRPKLVVGIIVDQMRYDYFYRFYDQYGKGGLKRFLNEGFLARNHHYHYALTVTGAGHASVYTGSAPAIHGVIGNDWFDRAEGRSVNCVEDNSVKTVGSATESTGKRSPKNLLVSTLADQLKLATNFRSKSIGISIKDRGAILPGGHTADAAYWFDSRSGNFVTSTYYLEDLPGWMKAFNDKKLPAQYAREGWNLLLPPDQYTQSTSDDQSWEGLFTGETTSTFPHSLAGTAGNLHGSVTTSPWGNTLLKDLAIATIQNENLGKGPFTDFLAVSFSSTDAVGHMYGPNSIEIQDTYLRLDRDFSEMFSFLDSWVGKDNYTVFLSADHGIVDVAGFWESRKLPSGLVPGSKIRDNAKKALNEAFGEGEYILASSSGQFYLDHALLKAKGITQEQVHAVIKEALISEPSIANVLNLKKLNDDQLTSYQLELYKNLVHIKRSGDIQLVSSPGWVSSGARGTTHGTPYNGDTHVPFALFGWGIKPGETLRRTSIADIAPTISALLHILPPNGSIGNPVVEALK